MPHPETTAIAGLKGFEDSVQYAVSVRVVLIYLGFCGGKWRILTSPLLAGRRFALFHGPSTHSFELFCVALSLKKLHVYLRRDHSS